MLGCQWGEAGQREMVLSSPSYFSEYLSLLLGGGGPGSTQIREVLSEEGKDGAGTARVWLVDADVTMSPVKSTYGSERYH